MQTVRNSILALLFALPVIFTPFTFLAFELPKVLLLYVISILAIYILAVSGYRLTNLGRVHWIYLIFLVWIVFTSILGLSLQQSFLGSYFRWQGILTWICYGLLFFISGKLFEDNHFRKHVNLIILISSVFTASLAIIQFVSFWFLGNTSQVLYSGRVISTFGQPNFLGAYLVMALPFVYFLTKHDKSKWRSLVWLSIIILVLGIFSTLSRSAYLGLAILALIWGYYHYRLLLTAIFFSVLLFAILGNLFPNLVYSQWYRLQVDTVSKWTAENRLVIAQKSIQLINKSPLLGYGLENFSLAFPSTINQNDVGLKDVVVDSSHNLLLDLGVQTGLIGMVLFLIILGLSIFSGLKKAKVTNPDNKDFINACISTCLTFVVIHQFSPNSVVPLVFFWMSLGAINKPILEFKGVNLISKKWVSILGIALILTASWFMIQTIKADILFRDASAYEVSDIHRAIKLDNDAIKLAPWIEFYRVRRDFLIRQLG